MNLRIGPISQFLTPGYSHCGRCGTTWPFVQAHHTQYELTRGCFPLCEKCWSELIPATRLPYYREMWLRNLTHYTAQEVTQIPVWADIERAVLEGK